jgi:glycine cleavage system H protein
MYPDNYKYTKEHEWVLIEGDTATIGITDHAQSQLGDIVYVELPEAEESFGSGDEFGSVESVKAVAEVYMPISGEVLEVNEALEDQPELVNKDPHDDGWLIKIKITDTSELEDLMDHNEYQELVESESETESE